MLYLYLKLLGKHSEGEISDIELLDIESSAIPGPGSCGGMYTANTMASAIEAMGMSLPNSSAQEAISKDKVTRFNGCWKGSKT